MASRIVQTDLDSSLCQASQHYNGAAIQDGLDFASTSKVIRNIQENKNDVSHSFKAALETVMAAATWPAARIAEVRPSTLLLAPDVEIHMSMLYIHSGLVFVTLKSRMSQ